MQNLVGQKFGRLTVISFKRFRRRPDGRAVEGMWNCKCNCGKKLIVGVANLKRPNPSCGCYRRENCGNQFRTHGDTVNGKKSAEYYAWVDMKDRCYDEKDKFYHNYGGRGIRVCRRWLNSYADFLADMGRKPSRKHTLDRIKNNGNYTPANCRWATLKEQSRNRRTNRILSMGGKRRCLVAWSELTGIPAITIHARIKRGWSVKRALTEPVQKQGG